MVPKLAGRELRVHCNAPTSDRPCTRVVPVLSVLPSCQEPLQVGTLGIVSTGAIQAGTDARPGNTAQPGR